MSRRVGAAVIAALAAALLTGCAASGSPGATRIGVGGGSTAAPSTESSTPTPMTTVAADPTVVTIGDSIMKGHGLAADEAWPALLAGRDGWQLDNLACDGAGFLAVGDATDCDDTFAGLVTQAAALDPQTVIVEGSSNDFGQNDGDLLDETVSQLELLRKALPDAQIIGLSTVWGDTTVPDQLADVDSQVQTAVQNVGGQFVSIGQPLSGHPEWMQSDDVHPTAAGQVALSDAVEAAFQRAGIHA